MTAAGIPPEALQSVTALHQLTLEACLAATEEELCFRMLNRSIGLCTYNRAALWRREGARLHLVGLSGQDTVDRQAPGVQQLQALAEAVRTPDQAGCLDEASFRTAAAWTEYRAGHEEASVCWIPLQLRDDRLGYLWFERWGPDGFSPAEEKLLASLGTSYAVAWRPFRQRGWARWRRRLGERRWQLLAGGALLAILLLLTVQVRLRVVAPCTVVAVDPAIVAAPLDGVIEAVHVRPGQRVAQGDLLAAYDRRVIEQELEVARRQVQIVEANLRRARFQTIQESRDRSALQALTHRLEQERARHALAQRRAEDLEIRASGSGLAVLEDPDAWAGRPVLLGQRILEIADPGRTRLRLWLPERDNIPFAREVPISILLNTDPGTAHPATLTRIAPFALPGPSGLAAFRAEAEWQTPPPGLKLGLQGSAIVYGPRVTLLYWLLRKPWAVVRPWLGL